MSPNAQSQPHLHSYYALIEFLNYNFYLLLIFLQIVLFVVFSFFNFVQQFYVIYLCVFAMTLNSSLSVFGYPCVILVLAEIRRHKPGLFIRICRLLVSKT